MKKEKPQTNGAAPEDVELLRLKAIAYDCIHQRELWSRKLEECNAEIARRSTEQPQRPVAPPAETEPVGAAAE